MESIDKVDKSKIKCEMEARELHTISTTPLVTSPFAVEWSEDDRISLVTEKHLHITTNNRHSSFKYYTMLLVLMALAVLVPTCSASDITSAVFGDVRDVMPAAFGDFDSDELTDMFVTRDDGRTLEVMLASDQEPFLRLNETLHCTFKNSKISGIVPGDFDGDALMDVLVTTKSDQETIKVYVMWGGMHFLNCSSDDKFLFKMTGEPLAIDYNGDMIIDLFGLDENKARIIWVFHKNRTYSAIPLQGDHPFELRTVHSHGFLDVNNDFAPDLVLTCDKGLEVWFADIDDGTFKYNYSVEYPKLLLQKNKVGQTLFLDVTMKGSEDILLPGCTSYNCDRSKIYIKCESHEWCDLRVNFKDPSGTTWGFNNDKNEPYTDTITLRGGDFNMDGYPDLLASLKQQQPDPPLKKSFLLKNVPCTNLDCVSDRTFEVQWNTLEPMNHNTSMAVFYDFGQDGTLDVLFVHKDANGKYGVSVFKNSLDYDANFMKVMVLTGLTNSETQPKTSAINRKKVKTFGSNLPGPSISYRTQTQEGKRRVARSSQLPQSAHSPLGLPYSIFGLGRTPNFIDALTVGLTGKNREWTQIIPNSQMLVIPVKPGDPTTWKAQLFVTPSKLVLMSVAALLATCSVITLIILALYWKERRQDKREKLQEAHRFHFDAM